MAQPAMSMPPPEFSVYNEQVLRYHQLSLLGDVYALAHPGERDLLPGLGGWILRHFVIQKEPARACPTPPTQILPVAMEVWLRDNLNGDRVRHVSRPTLIPCNGGAMCGPPYVIAPTYHHKEPVDIIWVYWNRLVSAELSQYPVHVVDACASWWNRDDLDYDSEPERILLRR
ncbi:hypothetical protein PIB30_022910 [Stylosanthes scabra]|uniref:Uncharacterized protein n=1 Tax=Stylosanthes scabra TaxID=79078 RepID=A0ABU6Z628_9FABA|nr:hypothetical protein [Stylosanthes scabra]